MSRESERLDQRVAEITRESLPELKNHRFSGEAALMGVTCHQDDTGISIEFAWRRRPSQSRLRFVHVIDDEGRVVAHGPTGYESFANHDLDPYVIDRIKISAEQLAGGSYLAVGFHSVAKKAAAVTSRQGDSIGFGLVFYSLRDRHPMMNPELSARLSNDPPRPPDLTPAESPTSDQLE